MSTTPNLGLTLPAHGATGWDTPLNTNFTTIDTAALRAVNAQTGTSYAIQQSDLGKWITLSNAAPIAVSIAQAGTGGNFQNGWFCYLQTTGAGTVTVTPTTSTINGGATITRTTSQAAVIQSDGVNYHAFLSA